MIRNISRLLCVLTPFVMVPAYGDTRQFLDAPIVKVVPVRWNGKALQWLDRSRLVPKMGT